MSTKSLPAYLQQVLEHHVAQSDLPMDDDLKDIISRLSQLNESVENIKARVRAKHASKAK